uniref:Uncharacterized protein n=1 Tax=Arundo donax TaxID=35708 RepID=A0A0A9G255_ARUDO
MVAAAPCLHSPSSAPSPPRPRPCRWRLHSFFLPPHPHASSFTASPHPPARIALPLPNPRAPPPS